MNNKNTFTKNEVVKLYRELESLGISIWIDGGWGIDILIGEQTREHEDLDIVIEECHLAHFLEYTSNAGYRDHPRDDTCDWNFVLENSNGLLIDVHVVVFDENGDGIYGPKERGIYYPLYAFTGKGSLDRFLMNCISPKYQFESHTGYTLREKDYQDIRLLCKHFKIPLPLEFR